MSKATTTSPQVTNLGDWKDNPVQDRKPGEMGTGSTPSPSWDKSGKMPADPDGDPWTRNSRT